MHVFPVETARLWMRPLSAEDEALYVALYSDGETMRFIGAALSHERAAKSFRSALTGMTRTPIERLYMTVMERDSGAAIGICSLQNYDLQRSRVQAGVMFVATAWAKGYCKESVIALVQRVFAELPVDELWVQFAADHVAVQRAVISMGFSHHREVALEAGPEQRSVWFVRRESWVASVGTEADVSLSAIAPHEPGVHRADLVNPYA